MRLAEIVIVGFGLLLVSKAHAQAKAQQIVTPLKILDPGNWYADQWKRLGGADLSLDGNHPAPGGFDAYGMQYEMGSTPGYFP